MSDYTPSTDEVREYVHLGMYDANKTPARVNFPAFDRWLESVRAEERERIAQVIENYATSDFQTRRLAYEQAARLARGEGA